MYERCFDFYLNNHRTRGNNTFRTLLGFQGRTGRILLSHSQRFILSRGLDKDKWSAFVYPGQMHVTFAIICQVDYARVRDINFTSAKEMTSDLDASIDNVPNDSFPSEYKLDLSVAKKLSQEIPVLSKAEMDQFFAEMSKSKNKSIAPSLIPEYAECYVCKSRSVPTIEYLFMNKFLEHACLDLLKVCQGIDFKITTKEQITQAESDKTQAKGTIFFKHRIGRIGASQCKAACNYDPALPSQTLIPSVCYQELNK